MSALYSSRSSRMSETSFSSSLRVSRMSLLSMSDAFFAAPSASSDEACLSARPPSTFSSSFSCSDLPPVSASSSPPMIASMRLFASAIFAISSLIRSPLAWMSSDALFILKVTVFQQFTQKPVSESLSSRSSLMFFRDSAISPSIWWIACAFIASLKRLCASAAREIDFVAWSTSMPRSP